MSLPAMAWIKMRTDLRDDPAVIAISASLELDEDAVVGKLHKLWSWADQQSCDGYAAGVTGKWVDRYLGAPGFASAMEKAGWLTVSDHGLTIPRFDRHNSESAKQRALSAVRMARMRGNGSDDVSVTSPQPEKRREDKRERPPPNGNGTTQKPIRSRRVPADFQLTPERGEFGLRNGVKDTATVKLEWAKFKDHEYKEPHSDWDAAWRTWVRRAADYQVGRRAPRQQHRSPTGAVI